MIFKGIYAIADDSTISGDKLDDAVKQALDGGINLLQYRNKSGSWSEKLSQATTLLAMCKSYRVPLIINDDIQLCIESMANGVHIGQSDSKIAEAREILGADAIIGVTCHNSIENALNAERNGATYVAFGRFFESKTKPEAPAADLTILTQAKKVLSIPVIAIGGINTENGARAIEAGADMIAVINYLFANDQVKKRAQELTRLFQLAD